MDVAELTFSGHGGDSEAGSRSRADKRRKRRRSPTRVVPVVAILSHVITLVVTVAALSALDTSVACGVIAVTAFMAATARVLTGALRFSAREVDLCWIIFQVGVLFWFCFPGLSRALQDQWYREAALVQITPEAFSWAWVGIVTFAAAFDTAYAVIRPGPKARSLAAGILGDDLAYDPRQLLTVLAVFATVDFVAYIALSGGVGSLISALLALRGGEGADARTWASDGNYSTRLSTFSSLIDSVTFTVAVVSGEIALIRRVRGRARVVAFVLWFAASGFVILIYAGTRSILGLCIGAPLSLLIRLHLSRGLKGRTLVSVVLAGIVIFWFSSFLRASRQSGLGDAEEVSFVYHDDIDFVANTALSYEIYQINGERDYDESAFWMILVNPIPRWIWRTKPDSQIVIAYSWYDWGVDVSLKGGNSLPSMVGQSLLGGGWLAVIITGLGWGLLAALGDAAVRDVWQGWALITWSLIAWWMFAAFRFIGPTFFTTAYFLLIVINARRLMKVFTRVHQSLGPALRPGA